MKQKLAIFDVDGTLFGGNLGIDFVKTLIKNKVFPSYIGDGIFAYFQQYQDGSLEKSVAVDKIYALYAEGMKGNTEERIKSVAIDTWSAIKHLVFPFTKDLVTYLIGQQYQVILLSGSPTEMISLFAQNVGATYAVGGTIEIANGIYTGNIISYPGSAEQKMKELDRLIADRHISPNFERSIAMGDNERDILILEKVGYGLAFEPNQILTELAVARGIHIVDRENVLQKVSTLVFE